MKVAHLTYEFPSLTETFIANEARALTRLGCDVCLIAFQPAEGVGSSKFAFQLDRKEPRVIYLRAQAEQRRWRRALGAGRAALSRPASCILLWASCFRVRAPLRNLDALLALQNFVESHPLDLIHAQFGYVAWLAMPILRRFRSLPLVVSFRGQDASALPRKQPDLYAEVFRRGCLFLARSDDMKRDLARLGCPVPRIRVHHSGIDLSEFSFRERHKPGPDGPIRVLFVGRLVEKKGILEAVEAFARVRQRHRNLLLRVIGDGPLHQEARRVITAHNLDDAVTLLGARSHAEVIGEMTNAHLFLLPCHTGSDGDKEGIPNALMEAMASGLPVISTRHAGIPECVEDGISGLLVPEADVSALADALSALVEHPERWGEMGRAGRARIAAEFNCDTQARKLLSLYQEAIARAETP